MVTAKGPLQDAPIHLHMTFPPTYPEAPPDVQLISDINAAFKIGDRLCIDMLRFSGFHGVGIPKGLPLTYLRQRDPYGPRLQSVT